MTTKSLALAALLLVPASAWAGSVSLVSGTSDPVKIQVTGKAQPDAYFRISPGGERLSVVATGPITLSVRFRSTGPGQGTGILRILRDEGPFSDNSYELGQDSHASADFNAAIEQNAVSSERVLHVVVPDGEHHYAISAVKGPPLLVRVFKTAKFDRALAAAPERNTSAEPSAPATAPKPAPSTAPEPKEASAVPPPPQAAVPPPPEPFAERPATTVPPPPEPFAERPPAPALAEAHAAAGPSPSEIGEEPATTEVLPEQAAAPPDPQTHSGMGIGVRMGTTAFLGYRSNQLVSNGPVGLSNRDLGFAPFDVDIAWDIGGTVSLFLDGSEEWGSRTFSTSCFCEGEHGVDVQKQISVHADYRVVPILAGLTFFVPAGTRVGVRFRLGIGAGFASALTSPTSVDAGTSNGAYQTVPILAGTVGVAFEVRFGPGRFTLEARYLAAPTTWTGPINPVNGFNAFPADLGGLQFLGGYRFELF